MRCKPGQLAWISHAEGRLRPNIGVVVRTVGLDPDASSVWGEPVWNVDAPAGILSCTMSGHMSPWHGGPGLVVNDSCLTPINDPDMDVDTVQEKDIEHVQ